MGEAGKLFNMKEVLAAEWGSAPERPPSAQTLLCDRVKARARRRLGSPLAPSPLASLGIGILAVALAALIRATLLSGLGARLEYLTFYPAVAIAALLAGLRAGAPATLLAALIVSLWPRPLGEPLDLLGLATFLACGALISGVAEAMRRASERATGAEERASLLVPAIRESEARLRLFFAHSPAAFAMFDRDMRYLAASNRWLSDYGLEGRDLIGLTHYEVFPESGERWREIHRCVLAGERRSSEADRFERADGRVRWLRWEALPWRDADDEIAGLVIFSEDVSERREAEIARAESESRLRGVFEGATDAIITINDKGAIQSANPATLRLFGYQPEELIGQNVSILMAEPHRSGHDGYLWRYLATGEPRIIGEGRETVARRKDGTLLPVEIAVAEVKESGSPLFVGFLRDISISKRALIRQQELIAEAKRAEKEARQQQELFSRIFDSTPEGVILTDRQDVIVMANPALLRTFGYEEGELVDSPLSQLFAEPDDWRDIEAGLASEEAGAPDAARRDIGCKRKSGEVFPAEVVTASYLDGAGEPTGRLVILRDVTWQQELRQAQRLEAVGRLTGGVVHDFNNLLTVISGNLQLLEMKLQDEGLRRYLVSAERAVQMGVRLNMRLTSIARQRRLEPALTKLNKHVINMLELLRRTLGDHITIKTALAEGLWLTHVDSSEVDNAILNLAINARDAMPNGGELIIETENVSIGEGGPRAGEELPPGAYVRLSVSDTGAGMAPEVMARAFEPFFTTKEPGKGAGLGLATLYGFAKQSGGGVALHSELGRGTTVSLYLPKYAPKPEETEEAESGAPAPPAATEGGGETILVVEDNAEVRRAAVERLQILGYETLEAENGESALAVLNSGVPVDLVFSDVVMPGGMSGFELARRSGELRPSQRMLLTSGFTGDFAPRADAALRDLPILRKPYDQLALGRYIRAALGGEIGRAQPRETSTTNT